MGERIESSREKIAQVEKLLNANVIGHEEENRLLLVGLVARENVAMIGPPGTAKTYRLDLLSKMINAKFYSYLVTRFTTDVELFGAYDIPKLTKEGKLERLSAALLNSDIVFLDEAFKASSAILNSLLSILQERVYRDPVTGTTKPVSVWTVYVASNEIPSDEELQALYDRFSLRLFVKYLDDDALILRAIEARWLNNAKVKAFASMDDVRTLHEYGLKILRSNIKEIGKFTTVYHATSVPFIKSLRSRGVIVSDRTIIEKMPKLIAAACAIYGLTTDNIVNSIIDLLPHLGKDPGESEAIQKAILEDMGEAAELHQKLTQTRAIAKAGRLDEALSSLRDIIGFDLTRIASKPWLKKRIEAIISEANTLYKKYSEIKATLERLSEQS